MASVKSPLLRKIKRVLTQKFPPPATVKLDDHDGIIGAITSTQFAGMETMDRQDLIGEIFAKHLTRQERQRVLVVVGVTPDEGTGYLADAE